MHAPIEMTAVNRFLCTVTHPFNGPFSGTTWVSRYQKGRTNLDFTEARDSEWQWHQLGKSASRSRQITMPVPHHSSFFTGQMPFLPPNQQRQSTEGKFLCAVNWSKLIGGRNKHSCPANHCFCSCFARHC